MSASDEPAPIVPSIQAIQTDVGFANQFRLELIKLILTLSPALLAFSVAFRPKLKDAVHTEVMWVGWVALGLATVGAMVNMYGWERFYASYRDHKDDQEAGKRTRKSIKLWRRAGTILQFAGFGVGVLAIAAFAALNIDKVLATSGT